NGAWPPHSGTASAGPTREVCGFSGRSPHEPRQALSYGQARASPRAPHHRDDDVPRDGHDVLAGGGGSGDPRRLTGPPLTFAAGPPHHLGMERRRFLLTSLAGAVGVPLATEAQSASKVPRIGYLSADTRTTASTFEDAFLQGLRELGYVEDRNIAIE